MLRVAHERNLQLDKDAALCLIRQLVPAVALLHENARARSRTGSIAPERLVATPHARLVIVEHVLSAAVEQLQFSRDRLWQEFRIAMPPSAGHVAFRSSGRRDRDRAGRARARAGSAAPSRFAFPTICRRC